MTGYAEHADVVVVGSGFGGSVSAYRLAHVGLSVVVLERGDAYPPGSFPRTPEQMSRSFWNPAGRLYGMFDIWRFSGCDSVVSSGLGGGSLIDASVLLRKDEHWFVQDDPLPRGGYESWPVTRADLDPHYDEVERTLGATPFPLEASAYAATTKTHAMRDAAAALGLSCQLPPLAVSFAPTPGTAPGLGLPIVEPDFGNLHGRPRSTCRLCGECNIGCNYGAKNSLDHTYLSAAQHHGADLRTGHEVRAIRPRSAGGYEVDYVRYDLQDRDSPRGAAAQSLRVITCDRLVLAAGTFGTSYLLLRNRPNFRGLSAALGTRFSSNGDVLSFLVNAGNLDRTRPFEPSHGPVTTSAIRLSDAHDGLGETGRGAYIEDGGYPAFIDWLVEAAHVPGDSRRLARFALERLHAVVARVHETDISGEISELVGSDTLSTGVLPLLGMGRDVPDGLLWLRGNRLDLAWTTASGEVYFERVQETMRRVATVLGARYVDNPMWLRKRIISVHPVGGAPMGRDRSAGVCDSYGEVFGYPGLYIADGAVMPGPVGPNPSLTIAALADRMCTRLLEQPPAVTARRADLGGAGLAVNRATRGPLVQSQNSTSLSFTEEMSGMYSPKGRGVLGGLGQGQQEPIAFRLTITADDVDLFLDDREHRARAEGWIEAASFGGRRHVQRGWFNLFAPDGAPDLRLMRYRLQFADASDQPRTLVGQKDVWHGPPSRIWPDTSTLHIRLLEGHVAEDDDDGARVLATGTMHMRLTGFARELTTFRTKGAHGALALERFGRFFAGQLWDVYGPQPGREPTLEELAAELGITPESLIELQEFGRSRISVLSRSSQAGEEEIGDLTDDSGTIEQREAVSLTLLQEQLLSILGTLSEREAGVVSMRFGLTDGQPKTLDEIVRVYGITRERVRQIESKTLSKLRNPVRSPAAKGYPDQRQLITVGAGYPGSGGSSSDPGYPGGRDRQRYLKARYPASVPVGEPFGLLASVVMMAGPDSVMLKPFGVPREGREIRLEAYAPHGLRLLGHRLLTVRVPADDNSEPVMFELCADEPGVRAVSLTAWLDGHYLGELRVDITAEHGHPAGTYRDVLAEITAEPAEGAVSLVVRFDSRQNAYRFEFRDEDNPDEVTSNLAYEPGPRVEQLIASLETLAKGRSGHDAGQARAHLVNSGAALWHELVPKRLRDQFWERQGRIRQLTILADRDAVPWELLYPMDPGHDKGFLVEQFPVTRAIFGRRPGRNLSLWPARFVLPEDSLPEARAEVEAMRVSLDPGQPPDKVISGYTPLQNLIAGGDFGLLHFACHNTYSPVGGSSIKLGNVPFTPTDIASAAINKVLARSAPTVFINACRSAGLSATYNRLDGWATKFLEAGAAAFIGSLWAVSDGAAREFAQELYDQLQAGSTLGQAVKSARAAAASQPDDPTWLAYAVYGDPRATLRQNRP